jgi:hypothetical protein
MADSSSHRRADRGDKAEKADKVEAFKALHLVLRLPDNLAPWIRQLLRQKDDLKSDDPLVTISPEQKDDGGQ